MAPSAPRIHLAASLGGHLELLTTLGSAVDTPGRVWVTAAERGADGLRASGEVVRDVPRFNRSRPLTALRNAVSSLALAVRERPRIVVTTGAGSVVAFCLAARLLGAKVIFVETMARVTSPSASGRVLARIADSVLVQWPEMRHTYPGAIVCRPALWEDVRAGAAGDGRGTFVSVGSHRHPFDRLLALVDEAVAERVLPEPVTAQSGSSDYNPSHYSARPMLTREEVSEAVGAAQYVVCHAGSGIISTALRSGRKPLVLARRGLFGEHVDDHQVQIVRKLSELDLIVPVEERISEGALAAARAGVRPPSDVADLPSVQEVVGRELRRLLSAAA